MNRDDKRPTYHYCAEKHTFILAKQLRKNNTRAEKFLWQLLRNRNFEGYKFRRQHPIGKYVSDFYCHQSRLDIESNGEIHENEDQKKYDSERDEFMEGFGLKILRINNEDLFNDQKKVLNLILKYLQDPLPLPLFQKTGEGRSVKYGSA
jgi:very-short-patch-repair endonuclease